MNQHHRLSSKATTRRPIVLAAASAIGVVAVPASAQASARNNVIVIIADDAGYADFGFMSPVTGRPSAVPTPNLDALAARGVTFSRAYVAANCTPTRAAVVTGGYQQRIGFESVNNENFRAGETYEGIPRHVDTMWERFKSDGYATGAIGKWHLGAMPDSAMQVGSRPQHQGVDEFYGFWGGSRSYTVGSYNPNQAANLSSTLQIKYMRETVVDANGNVSDQVVEGSLPAGYSSYTTQTFGDYAVDFINRHASNGKPFMLYQAFTAPHEPWTNESPDFNDPRIVGLPLGRRQVASMMITMDKQIGRMLDRLNDPNGDGDAADSIANNTTIVFLNDNGGVASKVDGINGTDNGPLTNYKGSPREGGIRVPMIVAGAGVAASKAGTLYDRPVHGIDILPTVLAAAGSPLAANTAGIDGVNLLPFVNGQQSAAPHQALVHRWRGTFAVIEGDWKLINTRNTNATPSQYLLFNVATDISETTNLLAQPGQAERIARMKRALTDHEAFFDKQRYPILGRTLETEPLNLFDHFVFRPGVDAAGRWSGSIDYNSTSGSFNQSNNWYAAGTTTPAQLLESDGFAGAVVELPVTNASYTSNNDLARKTGLEFMLNRVVLSGEHTTAGDHRATLAGKPLLFTKSLSGEPAQVVVNARNTVGAFGYNVDLDLIMYDDLTFDGDGNAEVTVNGQVSEYFASRSLIKKGNSVVRIAGTATHTGVTRIEGGTLSLIGTGGLARTSAIEVAAGAMFDVSRTSTGEFTLAAGQMIGGAGRVVGDLRLGNGAIIGPAPGTGTFSVEGILSLAAESVVALEISPQSQPGAVSERIVTNQLRIEGGTLRVLAGDPSLIRGGDTYHLFEAQSISGTFTAFDLPALSNGLSWDVNRLSQSGVISVVPEPTSLCVLSLIGFGLRRSRGRGR